MLKYENKNARRTSKMRQTDSKCTHLRHFIATMIFYLCKLDTRIASLLKKTSFFLIFLSILILTKHYNVLISHIVN